LSNTGRATEAELEALFGWKRGRGTSKVYTANAEQARRSAIGKLLRTSGEHSIPAPDEKVRAILKKEA
jgi:hypothetical protein